MRKKAIRKVCTGKNEYYVYDLDEDAFGKRKRLYGKTEAELKEKIEQAEKEKELKLNYQKPRSDLLKDYIIFYFKNAIGNVPAKRLKHYLHLSENAIFGSEIDKNITEISAMDFQDFLEKMNEKYSGESVKEIYEILSSSFDFAEKNGKDISDFSEVKIPERKSGRIVTEYILSPDEIVNLIEFCKQDKCTRYGKTELVVVFALMTGLLISEIQGIRVNDIDYDKKTLSMVKRGKKKLFPLSDECVSWLKEMQETGFIRSNQTAENNDADAENKGKSSVTDTEDKKNNGVTGISSYTYIDFEDNPLLFSGSRAEMPTQQAIQCTLSAIVKRCGLPKGVTGKTIRKAVIVRELSSGTPAEKLKERYGYRNVETVLSIYDEYTIRQVLF